MRSRRASPAAGQHGGEIVGIAVSEGLRCRPQHHVRTAEFFDRRRELPSHPADPVERVHEEHVSAGNCLRQRLSKPGRRAGLSPGCDVGELSYDGPSDTFANELAHPLPLAAQQPSLVSRCAVHPGVADDADALVAPVPIAWRPIRGHDAPPFPKPQSMATWPCAHTYLVLALAVNDLAEDRELERDIGIARVVLLIEEV